jgi:amidophosphoribosyltransferase
MCGIFGIYGHPEASNITYLGLHALQHRGQESAGIVSADGRAMHARREMGLVQDVSAPGSWKSRRQLRHRARPLLHRGVSQAKNAQPLTMQYAGARSPSRTTEPGQRADVRARLEAEGAIFAGDSDTEVIVHFIARSRVRKLEDQIVEALRQCVGAYSLIFETPTEIIGVRDAYGFRPLVLGRLREAYVLASETTALDLVEAEYVREIEPGEMVIIDGNGLRSSKPFETVRPARCVFEYVYFAKPDSVLFGSSVYETRKALGRQLAREQPAPSADLVIAVPDSGVPAAIGFSQVSGIPYDVGLIRSHYVGRTFIEPQQSIRHFGVKLKLSAVREVLRGKRVVVVDDSIVRGTTSRKIVKMIKAAGAAEVHLRISSPPTRWPCYYGIDTPVRQDLIAATHSTDEIATYVTADSLGYLTVEGLAQAVGDPAWKSYCNACFTGNYLTPLEAPQGAPATG